MANVLLVLLYPIRSYWRFIRNLRWPPPPSWIFKLGEFGTFCHVDSVVPELCTKLCSNICYSHWDRRYFVPDIHMMTSRQLTSGFDFWSRGHLRMAVIHLPIKFDADICPKLNDGGCRHLEFRENVNNSGLDKDIYTKFGGKMHHGHAEMTTSPKVETGSCFSWRHQMNVWSISASISVTIADIWTKFGTELKHHTVKMTECAKFTYLENLRWRRWPCWISKKCQ